MCATNRSSLQNLANERIKDAEALLIAGRWSGAYYLAGYAVECALKACFAKQTREYDFPQKSAQKVFTHNISELLSLAGIKALRDNDIKTSQAQQLNWAIVEAWNESTRYEIWTEVQARQLYEAVIALSGRVRQAGVNPADLDELQIPLPPLATQHAMVAEIEAEQALVAANRNQSPAWTKKFQKTLARIWGKNRKCGSFKVFVFPK